MLGRRRRQVASVLLVGSLLLKDTHQTRIWLVPGPGVVGIAGLGLAFGLRRRRSA